MVVGTPPFVHGAYNKAQWLLLPHSLSKQHLPLPLHNLLRKPMCRVLTLLRVWTTVQICPSDETPYRADNLSIPSGGRRHIVRLSPGGLVF